jgi:hypothetical protein
MAIYENAEIRHGGIAIRVNVEVDAEVPITGSAAGNVEWHGVLRPPNNTGLNSRETYTLVLPGFLPAKIEIYEEASPIDGSVSYKGVGEPPQSAPAKRKKNAG